MDGRRRAQREMSGAALVKGLGAGSRVTRGASDGSLAQRAAGGDERAFAAIFDRHHRGLYRYCLTLVGNAQDAQDALQNTMIKVLRGLPGEERQIALKPWLYRIAHNESIQLLRRRRETRPLDPGLRAAQAGLAEAAAARERLRVLISDLERLPERQRGALIMRELAGLEFAEIGTALGTSPAVVRQTIYEARLSLRQMDEGREMSCESVTRALSDGDGRVARRRDLRAHLRTCVGCRGFGEDIERREQQFASLAPLPAAAAAGLLHGLLAGHGAAGGGFAGALGGGAVKSLGASVAFKGAATVAVVAAIGAGAADRGGLIDLGLASADDSRVERAAVTGLPGARPARSGSIADDAKAGPAAGVKALGHLDPARTAKPAEPPAPRGPVTPGADAVGAETAKATETATPGDGQLAASGGAGSNAAPPPSPVSAPQDNPAGHPSGKGHEKQLPSASGHGQETASSHKAEAQGSEPPSHPEHPAHPAHPAQASNPAGEEPAASPVAPEANGNGNAKGKGTPPAAGAEETPSGHETGKKP